jgi:hypothetical protein
MVHSGRRLGMVQWRRYIRHHATVESGVPTEFNSAGDIVGPIVAGSDVASHAVCSGRCSLPVARSRSLIESTLRTLRALMPCVTSCGSEILSCSIGVSEHDDDVLSSSCLCPVETNSTAIARESTCSGAGN